MRLTNGLKDYSFYGSVCFDPTGISEIALALAVVGTAATAYGAYAQGQAADKAAQYNAQVASDAATTAQQQAQMAAQAQQRQASLVIGAARAGYGASGITSEGSPLDVLAASASNSELDRQTILYKGHLQAAGYQDEEQLDAMKSSQAQQSEVTGTVGALASGGAKIAGSSAAQSLLKGSGGGTGAPVPAGADPVSLNLA